MEDEYVLSEVHMMTKRKTHSYQKKQEKTDLSYISEFYYSSQLSKEYGFDSDGDLSVPRKKKKKGEFERIQILHSLETPLEKVGFQVWAGSLFLCDWILSEASRGLWKSESEKTFELGCGVGLVSILCAKLGCSLVIATDFKEEILENCQVNFEENIKNQNHRLFLIKHFDLLTPSDICPITQNSERKERKSSKSLKEYEEKENEEKESKKYSWNEQELSLVKEISTFFAADVIYYPELTKGFFFKLEMLFHQNETRKCVVCVEKRVNFTIDELAPVAKEYEYFLTFFIDCSKVDWSNNKTTQLGPSNSPKYSIIGHRLHVNNLCQRTFSGNHNSEFIELWLLSPISTSQTFFSYCPTCLNHHPKISKNE